MLAPPYGDGNVITPVSGVWGLHEITPTTGETRDSQAFKVRVFIPFNAVLATYTGTLTFGVSSP
jgi:hypothetical protein